MAQTEGSALIVAIFMFPHIADLDGTAILQTFSLIMLVAGSVVLHEYGHIFCARYLGIKTGDMHIHALGGLATIKSGLNGGKSEFLIAIAGPAVNVVIAALVFLLSLSLIWLGVMGETAYNALRTIVLVNVGLAIFNMLPILPMDGGRITRSAMSSFLSISMATIVSFWVGVVTAIGVIYLGYQLGAYGLILIPAFAILLTLPEYQGAIRQRRKDRLARLPKRVYPPYLKKVHG